MKKLSRSLPLTKKVLHHFTCWSLLFWQVTPVMGSTAEDELQSSVSTSTATSVSVGVGTSTGNPGDADGGVQKITGKEIDPKSKMLLSNIALFAAAFTAPTMVIHCPKMSTYIYAGASALYVANEIGLFTRFKTASDQEMAAYIGRGDEENQIDSLQTAAKQTRKAAKAAKTRALVSKIAAAGYGAASAMAIFEAFKDPIKAVDCAKTASNSFRIKNQNTINKQLTAMIASTYLPSSQSDVDTFFNFQEQMDFTNGQLSSPTLTEYESMKSEFGNKNELQLTSKLSKYIKLASELLIDSAHAETVGLPSIAIQHQKKLDEIEKIRQADLKARNTTDEELGTRPVNQVGSSTSDDSTSTSSSKPEKKGLNWSGTTAKMGVLGLGVAAAFMVKTSSAAIVKSRFVKSPYGRAAGFATFAAFSYGASRESDDAAKKLEARAREYDTLANQLQSRVNQDISTNGTSGQLTGGSTQSIDENSTTAGSDNNICFTGGPATVTPDAKCDCARTQSCKTPEIPKIDNLGEFNGKSVLVDSLKDFSSAGKDLYNGRLQTGTTKGQTLAKNAARITRLRDSMLDKLNQNRKKAGEKPVAFDALQKRFENGLLGKVNSAFNGLSNGERAAVARFAPGFGADLDANKDKEEKKVAEGSKSDTRKVAKGDINPNAGAAKAADANQGANWNFDFDENEPTEEEKAAIAAALAEEDENYVVEGDISEDRNKNLFNIITRRYLKSAYPVIFEEEN
jgi:hypothetical protein